MTYLKILPLQHSNMTKRPQTLPQLLFLQPHRPRDMVLAEGKREQRVPAAYERGGDGGGRELVVKDAAPYVVTESWLVVVVHFVEAEEVVS